MSGQPGVEDVNKQYLYHLPYSRFIKAHALIAINVFVSLTVETKSYVAVTEALKHFN